MIVLFRHSQKDFSFEDANFVVTPLLEITSTTPVSSSFFALFVALVMWSRAWTAKMIYLVMMALYAVGIYFLYPCCHSFYGAIVVIYYIIKKMDDDACPIVGLTDLNDGNRIFDVQQQLPEI